MAPGLNRHSLLSHRLYVEFRDGALDVGNRTLTGWCCRYNERDWIRPWVAETVAPRAFDPLRDDVVVNVQHDRGRPIARAKRGLKLESRADGLWAEVTVADTPGGDAALREVAAGLLTGWSVEMQVQRGPVTPIETGEGRKLLRRIEAAKLRGLALVDSPAWSGARLERELRWWWSGDEPLYFLSFAGYKPEVRDDEIESDGMVPGWLF